MERFRVGQWHGRANYECAFCAFSTLSREEMEKHLATRHPQPAVPDDSPRYEAEAAAGEGARAPDEVTGEGTRAPDEVAGEGAGAPDEVAGEGAGAPLAETREAPGFFKRAARRKAKAPEEAAAADEAEPASPRLRRAGADEIEAPGETTLVPGVPIDPRELEED